MKISKLFILSVALIVSVASCHHHDLSIELKDTEDVLNFKVSYPDDKTESVQKYFNNAFKPVSLFQSPDDVIDTDTSLDDGTHFHVKASAGEIELSLDKLENSQASYRRLKAIEEGLARNIGK